MRSWLSVALLFLLSCPTGFALSPERTVFELQHTAWTADKGGPTAVQALAQTSDGFLWVGSVNGLFRFDGIRFERFEDIYGTLLPSNYVYSLWAAPAGGLWIGYRLGGASFLNQGRLTSYTERDGLPAASTNGFTQDQQGVIWIATSGGLVHLDGQRWRAVGPAQGYPGVLTRHVYVDRSGTLWASTQDKVFALRRGASRFDTLAIPATYGTVVQAKDGTLWLADSDRGIRKLTAAPAAGSQVEWSSHTGSKGMLFDRDGTVWIGTGEGIAHLGAPPAALTGKPLQFFDAADGLSGNRVTSVLEDREGNIWFGTSDGLDRFREVPLVRIPTPPRGQYFSVIPGDAGAVWVSTSGEGLFAVHADVTAVPGAPREVICTYRDPDGTVWLGGMRALWKSTHTGWAAVSLPGDLAGPVPDIQAIAKDGAGDLWVSIVASGVYRLVDHAWIPFGNQPALPRLTAIAEAADPAGHVWFGYINNHVARFDGSEVRNFTAADGLHVGNVMVINARGKDVWVGGELGLAQFDGTRFRTLPMTAGRILSSVSGIVVTASGDVWVHAAEGVVLIPEDEVRRAADDPRYDIQPRIFSFQDGLLGSLQGVRPLPTAALGSDGKIWFASTHGVVWVDPQHLPRNTIAPPVWIESLEADGRRQRPAGHLTLPARTHNLQINYTAPSLSIPERVEFRYQLGDVDSGWQQAGGRRTAFYTDLAPGNYRFHVIASNNDGVWNETGATLEFEIPPAFDQTNLFIALCIAAGAGALWLIYLLRLRQLTARLHVRLQERMNERERIARELHDTLLQGMQGFILRFHALSQRVAADDPTRPQMKDALDNAQQVLVDVRDKVTGLRGSSAAREPLHQTLTQIGTGLSRDHPAQFSATLQGEPTELHPLVREEVRNIAAEALTNAFQHARARHIELEITYLRNELRLAVRDDGCGIDPAVLETGVRPGHWGLVGMQERAAKMGARLQVSSRPGAGTEVELRVPARSFAH